MRLFGYDFTAAPADVPALSLFGGVPVPVSKADIPAGATINPSASSQLAALAAGQTLGSTAPANGVRPSPGALPDETQESAADPVRFAFQWGANVAYTPRTGYGTPFSILRNLAATAPVVALCIQCRKDQMASLSWDFVPRDKRNDGAAMDEQIARARAFFKKPDGRRPHSSWLQLLVDEALTLDAVAIYRRPTNKGAATLAKDPAAILPPDQIACYEIIDGSTIKVLLDGSGDVPLPPRIAYRQIIWGQPMRGGDYTSNQLLYRPKTERTWTPYGLSPIEAALLIVTADLNRSLFNLSYYSDGNIPEALVGVPDTWKPDDIRNFNDYWNLVMAGDPKNRSRLRFVVETMAKSIHEFRKPDFTTQYDLWLLKMQCAMFGVTPSEIGFTDDVNKATAKSQGDVNQRRGVKPMANYLKAIHDEILSDLGLGDLECVWSGGEGEDALTQARIRDVELRNGSRSLDEVRADLGLPTLGAGPAVYTGAGLVFVEDAIVQSAATNGVADLGGDDTPDVVPQTVEPETALADDVRRVALAADLKKYRAVALKAVQAGKRVPAFSSAVIPAALAARLSHSLATAGSPDAVKAIFARSVRKGQTLSPTQEKAQRRMVKDLTKTYRDMGAAVAAHVQDQIEAGGL